LFWNEPMNKPSGLPEGKRFSHVYLKRDDSLSHSARFRTRVAAYLRKIDWRIREQIVVSVTQELGIHVDYGGHFFATAKIRDVLDSITVIWQWLKDASHSMSARTWLEDVARSMAEESLLYTVDVKGGVHRAIDAVYDVNRAAVIRTLGDTRYSAVAGAVEHAFRKLEQPHEDLKGAVRDMFEGAETLFKLLAESNVNLTDAAVRKHLQPIINRCIYPRGRPRQAPAVACSQASRLG
jgi:hypothetical protein